MHATDSLNYPISISSKIGMDSDAMCREAPGKPVCSGRGVCSCGQCECEQRNEAEIISGRFCECDNFSCNRHEVMSLISRWKNIESLKVALFDFN